MPPPAQQNVRYPSKHAAALAQARTRFQEGKYPEAEALCEQLLAKRPFDFDALYLLGAIRHARGRLPEALNALARALKTNSRSPEVLFNHGMILANLKRLTESLASYDRAVSLKPDWAEAHCNRGRVLLDLERPEAALPCFEVALKLKPDFVDALNGQGSALVALGKPDEAVEALDQALRLQPTNAHALFNLGTALTRLGKHEEAIANYEKAIAINPRYTQAHANCGVVLRRLKRYGEALASCDRAVALDPANANAWITRGNVLYDMRKHHEALESYDRATAADPKHEGPWLDRGAVLERLIRLDEALASYDRALAINPDNVRAWANRGNTILLQGRIDEALACLDHALTLGPPSVNTLVKKGVALMDAGRPLEAHEYLERALALEPNSTGARFNKCLVDLLLGNLADGWCGYEARMEIREIPDHRSFLRPRWTGHEPLAGKTLFVHTEQGLGDNIQFVRYASLLGESTRVVLEAPRALARLVTGMKGIAQVVCQGDQLPDFDFYCPLASLPLAFGTTMETIPNTVPYLVADPNAVAAWRQRLAPLAGLRVGLVWAGNPGPTANTRAVDRRRSMALAQLNPLAGVPGVSFVSLQKGAAGAQVRSAPAGFVIHDWTDELRDLADTAALIEALDLVISVDTSVVHLAGALAKPAWMFNRFDSEWRWLLGRDDSPWYPTLRQFRQPCPGDWASPVARVAAELANLAEASARS
ncbi:MAG TPA: tetratricopeptide repeat protein [Xanthobacteraceae bacterium]